MNMRSFIKCISIFIIITSAILLTSCGVTPDQVNDPLSDFDVDAAVPFTTKAVVTPAPTPIVTPRVTAAPTAQGISWQSVPGAYSTSYPTYRPTEKPAPTKTPGPREEELTVGSEGNNVKSLQQRLSELGYLSSAVDGIYGAKTKAAVMLLQETMGIPATGDADLYTLKVVYADIKTYAEMISSGSVTYENTPVPSTVSGYPLLQKGSEGADVIKLQQRLIQLGYLDTDADGSYGNVTAQAVSLFQKALGWEETGTATSSLQSYLYSNTAPYYFGDAPAAYATQAPAAPKYSQLSPGDSGESVKKLQKRLKELGYFNGETAGNYLTKTTGAVKLFQEALGLETTGIATAALQEKLYSSSAPAYSAPTAAPTSSSSVEVLQYGNSGDAVKRLQNRLKELGYFTGDATGSYFGQTESAVMLYQEQVGLSKTGMVDKALWSSIFSDNAPYLDTVFVEASDPDVIVLKPGDTGNKVKKLQTALSDLGYFDGEITGNYKDATANAVATAQRMMGYDEDGVTTYAVIEKLLDTSAPSYSECRLYTYLQVGSKSDDVAILQQRLIELGFFNNYTSSDKGKFTYSTLSAVKEAQKMRGLDCIDEFASPEFQAYLFSDAAYYHSYSYIEE